MALCYKSSARGASLSRPRHVFEVRAGRLVRLTKRSHAPVRLDAAEAAGLAVKVGPPVAVLGEALFAETVPIDEHAVPAGVAVGGCFSLIAFELPLHVPLAADAR